MNSNFRLTSAQKKWFFERLDENGNGKVIVPATAIKNSKKSLGIKRYLTKQSKPGLFKIFTIASTYFKF